LETLTNLETLVFDNREDHITSQSISKLTNLTYLNYSSSSRLRITDEAMQRLTKLKTLVVRRDGISEYSLSKLPNLTYLDCCENSTITTEALMEHPSLKKVRMLNCPKINTEELNKKGIVTLQR
jgi:Leucine-rich repeat (LRR) protein